MSAPIEQAPRPAPVRRPEGLPNREREPRGGNPLAAVEGRIARGGAALNPAARDLSPLQPQELQKRIDMSAFNKASYNERDQFWTERRRRENREANYEEDMKIWKTETTQKVQNGKAFFERSPKGQRWAEFMGKLGGLNIDVKNFTPSDAQRLYDHYMGGENKMTNGDKFLDDVLRIVNDNPRGLEENKDVIEWAGKMFGITGAEVAHMSARLEAKRRDPRQHEQLISEINAEENGVLRINRPGTLPVEGYRISEHQTLVYLWGGEQSAEPTPPSPIDTGPTGERQPNREDLAPTAPTPEDNSPRDDTAPAAPTLENDSPAQESDHAPTAPTQETADQTNRVRQRDQILEAPRREHRPLTTAESNRLWPLQEQIVKEKEQQKNVHVSEHPQFPDQAYNTQQLFEFVQGPVEQHSRFIENPSETTTLSADQMRTLELRAPFFIIHPDHIESNFLVTPFAYDDTGSTLRFIAGEKATGGDSGLLGLAAASAPDAERQGKLYKNLSEVVLNVHRNNPQLLTEWLQVQAQPARTKSIDYFAQFDRVDPDNPDSPLRPEKERLLTYDASGNLAPGFDTQWQQRIGELQHAFQNNQLQPHHLRWIEFLSHSVNVDSLMQRLKGSPTTPPPPADGNESPDNSHPPQNTPHTRRGGIGGLMDDLKADIGRLRNRNWKGLFR